MAYSITGVSSVLYTFPFNLVYTFYRTSNKSFTFKKQKQNLYSTAIKTVVLAFWKKTPVLAGCMQEHYYFFALVCINNI